MARDLGAYLCFEDEAGQGLRPPKGRAWGRRGHTPVVTVTAGSSKRVSIAALIATRPGGIGRARLIYGTHLDRGSGKNRRKGFAETDYARLLDAPIKSSPGPSSWSATTFPPTPAGLRRPRFGAGPDDMGPFGPVTDTHSGRP